MAPAILSLTERGMEERVPEAPIGLPLTIGIVPHFVSSVFTLRLCNCVCEKLGLQAFN